MKLGLRGRLFVGLTAVLLAVLAAGGALVTAHMRDAMREQLDRELSMRAGTVARLLRDDEIAAAAREAEVERLLRTPGFGARDGSHGIVVAEAPYARASLASPGLPDVLVAAVLRHAAQTAPSRDSTDHFFTVAGDGTLLRVAGVAVRGTPAWSFAAEDAAEIEDDVSAVVDGLLLALPACLAAAVLVAWLAARWIGRPIRDLAAAVEDVERGRRPVSIPSTGARDEVDALARSLERAFLRLDEAAVRESRFAAHAAHELRTPLATMLAQAETALRRPHSDAEVRAALAASLDAARRMHGVVDALLALARRGAPEAPPGGSDAVAVARTVASEAGGAAAAAHASVVVTAPAPVAVRAGRESVEIVVRNLVLNAIQHAGRGGPVEIRLSADRGDAVIEVRDRGEGIAPEHAAHVFEPFYRADAARSRDTGGAGLGLTLARTLARANGGDVTLATTPGEGACFTVRLPLAGTTHGTPST